MQKPDSYIGSGQERMIWMKSYMYVSRRVEVHVRVGCISIPD